MRIFCLALAAIATAACGCSQIVLHRTAPIADDPPVAHLGFEGLAQPQPYAHESQPAGGQPIEFYIQLALQRNPEIQARQRGVAAAAEVIPQVTSLPDPILSNVVFPLPENSTQTAAGRISNSLMLSQRFPWLGKLRLKGEVADHQTRIAMSQLAETQLKVIEAVRWSYYDIYFNQRAIEVTTTSADLLRKVFIPVAEARYRTGGSQQDILRAQVELDKVEDQLVVWRQKLKQSQADLAKLVALPADAPLAIAGVPKLPALPKELDWLYETAVAYRPELQGRLQAILRDEKAIALARLEYYPDVTLGATWNAVTASDALSRAANGNDSIGFLVAVNLPIWHKKLRSGVLEAENRAAESASIYESVRDDTFRQIRRLTVQAAALDEELRLYRDRLLPRAERTFRISLEDYKVKKTDALQVIDNWMLWLRLQIQQARLESAFGQTIASLERVVGRELARPVP